MIFINDVRLVNRRAIDVNDAVPNVHAVPGNGNDTFDKITAPVFRVLKNVDTAARWNCKPVPKLGHQDPIPYLKGRQHGTARYPKGLHHKGTYKKSQYQSPSYGLQRFSPPRFYHFRSQNKNPPLPFPVGIRESKVNSNFAFMEFKNSRLF
jgi:hypothetical protein